MKNWRLLLGVLVSLLCLYWAARGIDLHSLVQALAHVNYWLLLPAAALVALGLVARAYRWRLLLYPQTGLRIRRLYNVISIGYLVNNVSPFRLGDVLRAYLGAELEKLSVVRTLSTVLVERIADTLTILFLLLFLIPAVALPATLIRPTLGVAGLALVAVLAIIALAAQKERSLAWFEALAARVRWLDRPWLKRALASVVDGLAALGTWRTSLSVAGWSLGIWLLGTLQLYVLMWGAGLRLPFAAALAVLCFTSLGMTVPSSPGYIGVFEYLTVLALSLFGVDREVALGYALLAHAVGYLVMVGLGFVAAWSEGYSYVRLRDVMNRAGSAREST